MIARRAPSLHSTTIDSIHIYVGYGSMASNARGNVSRVEHAEEVAHRAQAGRAAKPLAVDALKLPGEGSSPTCATDRWDLRATLSPVLGAKCCWRPQKMSNVNNVHEPPVECTLPRVTVHCQLHLDAGRSSCLVKSQCLASPCEKRLSFLNFSYVCPEPVLVK